MINAKDIDIKKEFHNNYLPDEDDFTPEFKEQVLYLIETTRDGAITEPQSGGITVSLREFSKDIDIITRNRIIRLADILSDQIGETIIFTEMNYTPEYTQVDFSKLDLSLPILEIVRNALMLFEEEGIRINGRYTEPYLNHDLGVRIVINDAIATNRTSRGVLYEVLAYITMYGNIILDIGGLQWDQVLKSMYIIKLTQTANRFNEGGGRLATLFRLAFNLEPNAPIVTTYYDAERYLNNQYQFSDFSYPAKVEGADGDSITVSVLEVIQNASREQVCRYNIARYEVDKGNPVTIKTLLSQDIPLMMNMNDIVSFLHPQSSELLPAKLYKECKPLTWYR